MPKATLQQAARIVTQNPKATLQEMADVIVKSGGLPSTETDITTVRTVENYASVLQTEMLSEEIGDKTVVLLDELYAIADIDGRPSHKEKGATVYAENNVTGIISSVDLVNQTAEIITISVGGGTSGLSVDTTPSTQDPSSFVVYLPGGLIQMGGIADIGTMGPEVAIENTPVQFPETLADANFIPSLTVITGNGFQRIGTDVSNRSVTGFDICARNVGDETAQNIKIAWTVVGRKA